MLKQLRDTIETLKQGFQPPHTGRVPEAAKSDPVGSKTDWIPLKNGGSNFQTHRFVVDHPQRARFKTSVGALIMYSLFAVIGLGILIGFSIGYALSREGILIIFIGMGLIFLGVGSALMIYGTQPISFDQQTGFYWKGRTDPRNVFDVTELKNAARLSEVYAVQLLSKYVTGDKGRGYYSYELNLVLNNGERLNVVDYGNKKGIRTDAEKLAQFLDKPLWDAS